MLYMGKLMWSFICLNSELIYTILIGKPKRMSLLRDLGIKGRIILK